MRSSFTTIAAVVLASATFAAAQLTHPSAQAAAAAGFKGRVGIRATPNRTTGGPGGSAIWDDLNPGESTSWMVTAGRAGDLCVSGVAGPLSSNSPDFQSRVAKQEASAVYVWHFDVRVIDVQVNAVTFDLTWQRTSRFDPERPQYSQRLTLRDNESRPIDLLHGTPGSDCINVAISVEAGITDDPSLLGKILDWDLWASTGSQTAARQTLRSVQGDVSEFKFDPMTVPGSANDEQVVFSGSVTGRVRLDGDIDVAITVGRMTWQEVNRDALVRFLKDIRRQGDPRGFRKNFTAKPGEAVKIVLPGAARAPLIRTTTDPATGERITSTATPAARAQNATPAASEMSITVQARVR